MDIDWIKNQLEREGYTQRGLALAMGVDPAAVSRMLTGDRRLQVAEIPKVAAYFAATPGGEAAEAIAREISQPFTAADQVGAKDLPVYASAEGGEGAMVIVKEPIEWVRRPEPLLNVIGAFACYVINDSMHPAYDHGDLILVHPHRPVGPDKDCLFVSHHDDGGFDALVKRLLRVHSDRWRVRQHNPAKDFDLNRQRWQQAMAIVGKYHGR